MIHSVVTFANGRQWVDVSSPTAEELKQLAVDYAIHPTSVKDCLQPEHLPKFEKIGARQFIILRYLDERALKDRQNDTVVELTRKVSLFIDDKCLVTVHRKETPLMERVRARWSAGGDLSSDSAFPIVLDLFRESILSFDPALALADRVFEGFETRIFSNLAEGQILEEMYFLKRRVSVYRRVLRQTLDIVPKLNEAPASLVPFIQDIREETERLYGWAQETTEAVTTLLSSHISLASHRTNETMRLLTIFSVFFMPLTFIVGVYGMNFHYMPELSWKFGYPATWLTMLLVVAGLYGWFRQRGWLR